MNTALFFEPVDERFLKNSHTNSFAEAITVYHDLIPNWKNFDIALFTVGEVGDSFREKLYSLKKGNGIYKIVDLGILKAGETNEDTQLRLSEVCKAMLEASVIPFVIGENNSLALGQFGGFEGYEEPVSISNVDALFDLEGEDEDAHYLQTLFGRGENLAHYAHLAHQSYLVNTQALTVFEKMNFEGIRLGEVRQNIEECEPVLRASNMLIFDVSAIKHRDFPANHHELPFGLSGEEACQLFWYAGLSNRLNSVGLYGFSLEKDQHGYSAMTLATMVWYFAEGYYARLDDMNFEGDGYFKYTISFDKAPHELVFYKHRSSGKWWMLIDPELKYNKRHVVPCSYIDYQLANTGELPDRWIRASARIL